MAKKKLAELADVSSVIRVLNVLGAEILPEPGSNIFFKTSNRKFISALEKFAATYKPLADIELHDCGNKECSLKGYYVLNMQIQANIHQEAAEKLAELLDEYDPK